MPLDLVNALLKTILMSIGFYILFAKIQNISLSTGQILIRGLIYVFCMIAFVVFTYYYVLEPLRTYVIIFLSFVYFFSVFKKNQTKVSKEMVNVLINTLIAYSFNLMSFVVALYISSIIIAVIFNFKYTNVIILLFSAVFYLPFIMILNRFKLYLKIKKARGIGVFWSLLVLSVFSLYPIRELTILLVIVIAVIIALISSGMLFWWKRETANSFEFAVKENQIDTLQNSLDNIKDEYKTLRIDNKNLASQIHENNNRLLVLQRYAASIINESKETEGLQNAKAILSSIMSQQEFDDIARSHELYGKALAPTGNKIVDALLEMKLGQSVELDIEFNLFVNGSINGALEFLPLTKIITLIGDLIDNAFIAVKNSEKSKKFVNVYIGNFDNTDEISVEDNGIPFEVSTLVKLGSEQVTTHAAQGGSGNGYISLFKYINECKASLVISDSTDVQSQVIKSVAVRFDGKNKYIIETDRAEELKNQSLNPNIEILWH